MKFLLKFKALFILCFATSFVHAQYEIKPKEGFTPQIGIMVDMLEELKDRITEDVRDLTLEETDFLFDDKANSIGAMIMHLAATESYTQVETLEGRRWTEGEAAYWAIAGGMGDESREKIKGKPIKYYLDLWDEVRQNTLAGLKTKDDAWFAANIDEGMDNHWAWFHILEHGASHMGQIALVKSRLPKKP
ncbi:MAG: DinB family protein [Maribacter sp.]|nr:DinB family protein [Maribacter sp.]